MAELPLREAVRGKGVEVEWMPFELRPEGDYLQRAWRQSVYPIARQMGVPIKLPTVSPPQGELAMYTRRLDLDGLLKETGPQASAPKAEEGPRDL